MTWKLCIATLAAAAALMAQPGRPAAMRTPHGDKQGEATVEGKLPGPLKDVKIEQRLNTQLPLDATFTDVTGARVTLGSVMSRNRPAVLALVYYECKMLCNMTLSGIQRAARVIPNLSIGRDWDVIAISFDAKETPVEAAKKQQEAADRSRRPEGAAGWHFLTGDQANIRRVADAAGFRYAWDENSKQWAHSSAIMVLTPEGKLSRYFYGVEYSARDLRLGLVEASAGKIGSPVDQLLLFCYHYDPVTGKYGMVVMTILRIASLGMIGLILLFWVASHLQNKRRKNVNGDNIPAFTR
jgi:protein SCO1/2